jgi:hypothetical protein
MPIQSFFSIQTPQSLEGDQIIKFPRGFSILSTGNKIPAPQPTMGNFQDFLQPTQLDPDNLLLKRPSHLVRLAWNLYG